MKALTSWSVRLLYWWCGVALGFGASGKLLRAGEVEGIQWQPWSDHVFQDAQKQHRFVLLDLGAGWCHWCHVMDTITYEDPEVIRLIREKYLPVRVDQDSRPDLANRYEDFGWPATVVFNVDGSEIVKRQGYLPPKPMASMLQAIIEDPSPGPSVQPETPIGPERTGALSVEQRKLLKDRIAATYDPKEKGWGTAQKYLDWDVLEWSMVQASGGDGASGQRARETLAAQRKLIDPVWGGVCQYSTDGDWVHPHFEKLLQFQAENLRIYALAYAQWKDKNDLEAARQIHGYMTRFLLSPEGAFYTSQDADLRPGEPAEAYYALPDAERRAQGIPRVDQHLYARENGWAIAGLCAWYDVVGDPASLAEAEKAAHWVLEHRQAAGGGFRHAESDRESQYLGDNVAMARAFLCLYASTADRAWLVRAEAALHFGAEHFRGDHGYVSSAVTAGLKPRPQLDENVSMARVANLLFAYTGNTIDKQIADHTMSYLALPSVTEMRGPHVACVLLADRESAREPLHITIVGAKSDPAARALYTAALRNPATYRRVEWWDRAEGSLPRMDVTYPELPHACAFVCTANACSSPMVNPQKVESAK